MSKSCKLLLPIPKMIKPRHEGDGSTKWVAEWTILTYGVRAGIRTNRPEALMPLAEYFPPFWKSVDAPTVECLFSLWVGSPHALYQDGQKVGTSRSLKVILELFERQLKIYVAEMARRKVFVHAGAVGWQGKAIIIPGRSMTGKTSLVAELVRAGAIYYSDEYAVLDAWGRVHPYPQPLAMRAKKPGSFKQKKYEVAEIGGVVGVKPLDVGLVIASRYEAGVQWRPERLSSGRALLELLANTVPARRKPGVVMPALHLAVSNACLLKGPRGEATETAKLILAECQS